MIPMRSFIFGCLWTSAFLSASAQEKKAADVNEDKAQEAADDAIADPFGFRPGFLDPQTQMLQRYVRTNCGLARRACKLSEEQEKLLSKIDGTWINAEIKKATDSPVKAAAAGIAGFLGARVAVRNQGQNQPHEIIAKVRKEVDKQIETVLEEQQAAAYKRERESRDAFRRDALAGVLVAALDRRVFLTPEQRVALQPLIAKWLTKDLYWQFYFQNQGYNPAIPNQVLLRVLDAKQLGALKGAQAYNYDLDQIEIQMIDQEMLFVIEK